MISEAAVNKYHKDGRTAVGKTLGLDGVPTYGRPTQPLRRMYPILRKRSLNGTLTF